MIFIPKERKLAPLQNNKFTIFVEICSNIFGNGKFVKKGNPVFRINCTVLASILANSFCTFIERVWYVSFLRMCKRVLEQKCDFYGRIFESIFSPGGL